MAPHTQIIPRDLSMDESTAIGISVPICIFVFIVMLFCTVRYTIGGPPSDLDTNPFDPPPPSHPEAASYSSKPAQRALPTAPFDMEDILEPPPAYIQMENLDPAHSKGRGGAVEMPAAVPAEMAHVRSIDAPMEGQVMESSRVGLHLA